MSSPATLPMSTTSSTTTTTATSATTTSTTISSLRIFLSSLTTSIRQSLSHRRPWLELIDRTAISRPENLSDAVTRIRKNTAYFRVNYLTFISLLLAFSLLSHPFSLLTLLSLLAAWFSLYLYRPSDRPVAVFGRTFSDRETLGILIIVTLFVVFLTSVGSLLISTFLIGSGIVCLHGAFRVPEDLFLDDMDSVGGGGGNAGLLSFLGDAAASSATAAAARV